MFGDDDPFGGNDKQEAEQEKPAEPEPKSFSKANDGMKLASFYDEEADDGDKQQDKEESMAMEED